MAGVPFRIGYGFDVHQLAEGREFWLGGIKFEHPSGPLGHSDADVLLHAICDALLGALALGDIGQHFPDTDATFKNIDSKILLKHVAALVRREGYEIGNIDATIILESPKVMKRSVEMRETIANCMDVTPEQISLKATTSEKMGYIGRKEGLAAHAVALVYQP